MLKRVILGHLGGHGRAPFHFIHFFSDYGWIMVNHVMGNPTYTRNVQKYHFIIYRFDESSVKLPQKVTILGVFLGVEWLYVFMDEIPNNDG